MNRKTVFRLLTAVIIICLLIFLFRSRTPFGGSNAAFASLPGKEITRIELSGGNQRINLEKEGEEWFLNGGTETRKTAVLFILRILGGMQIKSPVSRELFDSVITSKNVQPVLVRTYENRKLVKSFLVYKTPSNIYGNIMKLKERSKPFIVHLPGFDGNIGSGFTLNELFWKPYVIFNLLPSEIASVEFINYHDTLSSFSVISNKSGYRLTNGKVELEGWDSVRVARYLSYFTRVPFESWAFDLNKDQKKEIISATPAYRITVNRTNGDKNVLTLWERMKPGTSTGEKDTDRMYGNTLAIDELFIIRFFDIDPLLKKREYFFGK